ncbi:MAG: protein kinase [Planctomycetaceae bacterium]|nr:protein kinase [Planctomycetaceae bacterium]
MAHVNHSPTGGAPQGPFERLLVERLRRELPDGYELLPNFSLKNPGRSALEYDLAVLAPHAVFVIEAKEWYGRLTGDDTEWLINQTPKKCPMWLVDLKCKVLKGRLGGIGSQIWVEPLLVVPDGTQILLGGNWSDNVHTATSVVAHLQDRTKVRYPGSVDRYYQPIIESLQGQWAARRRNERRRISGYEVVETVAMSDEAAEYIARRALVNDPTPFRIRSWRVSPYADDQEREQRLAVIKRPTEAVARIGRHPNLLHVLDFSYNADDNEFHEVTEWSEYGTLHGFLANPERDRLTIRERLQIAAGVARALTAVHERDLVHRNLCPQTILIGFDRQPRITDFDRAYIAGTETVFAETVAKRGSIAYVPPELADSQHYEFDTCSDMYSFGVLLYELIAEELPFTNPASAVAAGGRPEKLPSEFREGVAEEIDQLVLDLLKVSDFHGRPSASDALEILDELLDASTAKRSAISTSTRPAGMSALEVGDVVDGVFRIDAILGQGAFSSVYKVYHLDHAETYAMKLLTNSEHVDVILHEYNQIGKLLPTHKNIARVIWMARLAPPIGTPYILSEYVAGETLEPYCKGDKKLSWRDIRSIGGQLLDALDAMHPKTRRLEELRQKLAEGTITAEEYEEYQAAQEAVAEGFLHRDIKPANILLEHPSHTPKLIDFNIASKLVEASGRGGTPRYWAPDRGRPDWRPDMDLFSLGIVLYELVTHCHPFPDDDPEAGMPYDPRDICPELHLSQELADFLQKSIHPNGSQRFQSAIAMKEAILSVHSMYAPIEPPIAGDDLFSGITVTSGELGKINFNPYVTRLLTLYSQARRTNAGTRGLDEIARLTYVKTRLDERLAPAIVDGRFRLVIITGNAGDGKTAFLQQVEELFRTLDVQVEPLPTENGSRWSYEGLQYESNYDGSQDEGNVENDNVLANFLAPFIGDQLSEFSGNEVRLIAINEGRLLDFLEHSEFREEFSGLRRFVHVALEGAEVDLDGILLVNLNLRAVTAGGSDCLLEKQLTELLKEQLWRPCDNCELRDRCPIKHNVDSLRDEASGAAVRVRVRRLFEVIHLRRRAHVTMRDLRSVLSWMLLRDHDCDDVARLLSRADNELTEDLANLYYPNAFADEERGERQTVEDRLVERLREVDVGLVNSPQLDRRIDHDPTKAVPWMTFEERSDYALEIMKELCRSVPRASDDAELSVLMRRRRGLLQQWRRWAFFERRDEGWRSMLPYRSLSKVELLTLSGGNEDHDTVRADIRDAVVEAISYAEGLRNPMIGNSNLALRVSRVKDPTVRSYRLFPKGAFRIEVAATLHLAEYLECAPDAIDLVASEDLGQAKLRLSLDLLEMLELIRRGYRPSTADLQGLFVNLMIFRNELLNLPFSKVIVTQDDASFYEISSSADASGQILLSLSRANDTSTTEEALA